MKHLICLLFTRNKVEMQVGSNPKKLRTNKGGENYIPLVVTNQWALYMKPPPVIHHNQ